MSERLLKEYLHLALEAIRSKKGSHGDKFDLGRFKRMRSAPQMMDYADQFLDRIGQGSARVAYTLSGKYVLKISRNEKGIAQNEAELDVYTNPKSKPVVAKIYAADDDNQWVIADLVKPISSPQEFQQLTKVDWKEFSEAVEQGYDSGYIDQDAPAFIRAVVSLVLSNQLKAADLIQQDREGDKDAYIIGHWGKTPDGRVVLLDYGYTEGVWQQHYKNKGAPAPDHVVSHDPDVDTNAPTGVDSRAKTRNKGDIGLDKTMKAASGPKAAAPRQDDKTAKSAPAAKRNDDKTAKSAPAAKRRSHDAEKTKRAG